MNFEELTPAEVLGAKIRGRRQRLNHTLEDVASTAGISKPFLSLVERGLANPSIASLKSISDALGVAVQYFMDAPGERRSVHRAEHLEFFGFADSANLFARMTNKSGREQLEAFLVKMPPGQRKPTTVATHAGEEFLYVISGKIALTLEGKTFVLHAGDSAHYESTLPHSWSNTQHFDAVAMWVGTPKLL